MGVGWLHSVSEEDSESALREVADAYQRLIDFLPEAVLLHVDGNVVHANSAAAELFGAKDEADLFGRSVLSFVAEDYLDLVRERITRTGDGRQVSEIVEEQLLRLDGTRFPAAVTSAPAYFQGQNACQVVIRDLSQSHQVQQELDHERKIHQRIIQTSVAALIRVNADGRICFANRLAKLTLGDGRQDILGFSILDDMWRFEDRDGNALTPDKTAFAKTLKKGLPVHGSVLAITPPWGQRRLVQVNGSALRREDGEIEEVVFAIEDITEYDNTARRLRLAASVFDATSEGIMVTDADSRVLSINDAFTRITGYELDEIRGKSPGFLTSGRHDKHFYADMWQCLQEEGCWSGEIWNRRKNGQVFPEWQTINAVKDDLGRITNYVAVFSDITQIKESQEEIEFLANHDPLTGLPNRNLLVDRVNQQVQLARREKAEFALIVLDLDHFKYINDSLGHSVGDELLDATAHRLKATVRDMDTVARLGGDEFVILLSTPTDLAVVQRIAPRLINAFDQPFKCSGRELHITPSCGIAFWPKDSEDARGLIQNADAAMYQAKRRGRNQYAFYTGEMTDEAMQRVQLENALRVALREGQLRQYYQPQVDAESGLLSGVEALARWEHPDFGIIPPSVFVPLAEETDLIILLGEWALRQACKQMKSWLDQGYKLQRVAVNVAGVQLEQMTFADSLLDILDEAGLPPEYLEIEITEGWAMDNLESITPVLTRLRGLGIEVAIDDFGTGYSSLSRLKQLPVDTLKVDRSFVMNIPDDPSDMAVANAVIALAQIMGKKVTAEGVETAEQEDFLVKHRCDRLQGFRYGKALSVEELEALMHQQEEKPRT